jgi:hypothetical protein
MITVIDSPDLIKDIPKYEVTFIGTNIYCTMSQGIQREIALNYPYVKMDNLNTKYGDPEKMGTFIECMRENEPRIALMFMYRGYFNKKKYKDDETCDYEAIRTCLKLANEKYKGMNAATTFLGCSRFDGNGKKELVLPIMEECLTDLNVTVYDYHQQSKAEKLKEFWSKEQDVRKTDYQAFREMVRKRKEEAEERFKRNGMGRY